MVCANDELARFWVDKRVLVTGGAGSGVLCDGGVACRGEGQPILPCPEAASMISAIWIALAGVLEEQRPHIVIHLAAKVGGIGANLARPGSSFTKNPDDGDALHESWRVGVQKFVAIGTVCAYPKFAPVPFSEEDLWQGYPEETNAPYGLAKKMLLVQSQAYRGQYGFNSIFLLPVNLYGPRDNFDPGTSHVIPALIKKCLDARELGRSTSRSGATEPRPASFSTCRMPRGALCCSGAVRRQRARQPRQLVRMEHSGRLVHLIARRQTFQAKSGGTRASQTASRVGSSTRAGRRPCSVSAPA